MRISRQSPDVTGHLESCVKRYGDSTILYERFFRLANFEYAPLQACLQLLTECWTTFQLEFLVCGKCGGGMLTLQIIFIVGLGFIVIAVQQACTP